MVACVCVSLQFLARLHLLSLISEHNCSCTAAAAVGFLTLQIVLVLWCVFVTSLGDYAMKHTCIVSSTDCETESGTARGRERMLTELLRLLCVLQTIMR